MRVQSSSLHVWCKSLFPCHHDPTSRFMEEDSKCGRKSIGKLSGLSQPNWGWRVLSTPQTSKVNPPDAQLTAPRCWSSNRKQSILWFLKTKSELSTSQQEKHKILKNKQVFHLKISWKPRFCKMCWLKNLTINNTLCSSKTSGKLRFAKSFPYTRYNGA
jgi:hypothetical protein